MVCSPPNLATPPLGTKSTFSECGSSQASSLSFVAVCCLHEDDAHPFHRADPTSCGAADSGGRMNASPAGQERSRVPAYPSSRHFASHLSLTTGGQRSRPLAWSVLHRAGPALERASEGLIPRLGGGNAAHEVLAVAHVEIEVGEELLLG